MSSRSFGRSGHAHRDQCNSATGTRTRVAGVRAEYPNQLGYSGIDVLQNVFIHDSIFWFTQTLCKHSCHSLYTKTDQPMEVHLCTASHRFASQPFPRSSQAFFSCILPQHLSPNRSKIPRQRNNQTPRQQDSKISRRQDTKTTRQHTDTKTARPQHIKRTRN